MIDISVQKQITNVIDPIVKCQDNFEAQTNSQYAAIAKEFAYLKQSLANPQPTPSQNLSHNPAPENTPLGNTSTHTTPGSVLPLWDIVEKAERTVGFQPISRVILTKSARVHNTDDAQYAMKLLILEYLKFEMKNSVTDICNIVKVFPPDKPNWNTLYVEFDTRATTQKVYSFTRLLRYKEHKVTMYVPHPYWNQFDHLGNIAYKCRQAPNIHKTIIKFGQRDMLNHLTRMSGMLSMSSTFPL